MSWVYYNEHDKFAAAWLNALIDEGHIAPGEVDTRSIVDVKPSELGGYSQHHFFAGIGGWSHALRLAGWPDDRPVWTGSCPCQPFSLAGKQGGFADERHLWPVFFNLIRECRPSVVFGEQVASAAQWLGLVRSDLEAVDYAVGAIPIEAASAGADHRRDRFWFVAYSAGARREGLQQCSPAQVSENGTPKTLGAWDGPGNSFANWRQLMAGTKICRLADGVSSNLAIRPTLRGFGNAIDPRPAAAFIRAAA